MAHAREGQRLQDIAWDAIVIGAGSAGLAAASAVAENAQARVLVLDRESHTGGVLVQCVHEGFGLYVFGDSLTGPEYALRWTRRAWEAGVTVALESTVLDIHHADDDGFAVEVAGVPFGGYAVLSARCVICATGCRERTRGSMLIPGGRPSGVLTAGSAQYMVNVEDQLPGDKVAILGSGDIGLIMARRMALEGADVRMVLGQEATGLVRNHIRCIQDFGIPIRYGWGLASVHGFGRLQGITIAPMANDGTLDMARKEYLRCNVLLIACGLIPEREVLDSLLSEEANAGRDGIPDVPGLFVCGNASRPHDLVDQVTQEGARAGVDAACYLAACREEAEPTLSAEWRRLLELRISELKGRMGQVHGALPEGAQRIVCTECPTGCVMVVSGDGRVEGNTCERGRAFALREAEHPTRLFTGTVRVEGAGARHLVPVRTEDPVPKETLRAIAHACRRLRVTAPVHVGDVVARDIAGSGGVLVASDDCPAASGKPISHEDGAHA